MKDSRRMTLIRFLVLLLLCMDAGGYTEAIRKIISDEFLQEDKIQKPLYNYYLFAAFAGRVQVV